MEVQEQEYEYQYQRAIRDYREKEEKSKMTGGHGALYSTLTSGASKMDWVDLVLGILVGGVFDLLSLIPKVGSVLGPIGVAVLTVWLWFKGVRKLGNKAVAGLILELIPIINWLPACIGFVVRAYATDKAESKLPVKALQLNK
ncbi:hypothetical protein C4553_03185 [Candidatus Parcubacteria bacterium]|nr:MAG: hypothetical protein C4553_03185 [Candidatus Parcubacteria bacterium]